MFGIKFAPCNVPFRRRLQTLAVCFFIFLIFFAIFCPLILIYLLFTRFYWITVIYVLWYLYDYRTPEKGGRKIKWILKIFEIPGRYMADYFPTKLVKTASLPPDQNYILAGHPHGVFSFPYVVTFAMDCVGFARSFPGLNLNLVTLAPQHYIPLSRDICQLFGTVPCSRESIDYILGKEKKSGKGVVILLGGSREIIESHPKTMTFILKNRKGFVRMALRHGASIVPVIAFGLNDIFDTVKKPETHWFRKFQEAAYERFSSPIGISNGRGIFQYSFGMLPHRKPMHVVVGKPIQVEQSDPEPSQEEIDQLHQRYIKELTELYNEHKEHYGYGDVPLIIK